MFFLCLQMYVQEVEDLNAECSRGDFLAKVFKYLSISTTAGHSLNSSQLICAWICIDEGLELPTQAFVYFYDSSFYLSSQLLKPVLVFHYHTNVAVRFV